MKEPIHLRSARENLKRSLAKAVCDNWADAAWGQSEVIKDIEALIDLKIEIALRGDGR